MYVTMPYIDPMGYAQFKSTKGSRTNSASPGHLSGERTSVAAEIPDHWKHDGGTNGPAEHFARWLGLLPPLLVTLYYQNQTLHSLKLTANGPWKFERLVQMKIFLGYELSVSFKEYVSF